MSYETNPISNRLNFTKGWKNPTFPEALSLYPQNNVTFFKIYLFLKAYFTIRKIKLLSCEIRLSENYRPILYLVINTTTQRKKKRNKSKRRINFLKKYHKLQLSPLRNPYNRQAINSIFFNLTKLKKFLGTKLFSLGNNLPTKLWLTKTRKTTWINHINLLKIQRNHRVRSALTTYFKPTVTHLRQHKLQEILKKKLMLNIQHLKNFTTFLKLTKKFGCLNKQTIILYKNQLKQISRNIIITNTILNKVQERNYELKKNKLIFYKEKRSVKALKNLKEIHSYLFQRNLTKKTFKYSISFLKQYTIKTQKSKKRIISKLFRKRLKNLRNARNLILTDSKNKNFILNAMIFGLYLKQFKNQKLNYKFIQLKQRLCVFNNAYPNNLNCKNIPSIYFKNKQKYKLFKIFSSKHPQQLKKIQLKKKTSFLFLNSSLLRRKSKFNIKSVDIPKISAEIIRKNYLYKKIRVKNSLKNKEEENRSYKQPFRNSYRNHLNILVRYQYKLWIQKLLQTFFKLRFEIKFSQPLTQFKNLKFLRLFYPIPKFQQQWNKRRFKKPKFFISTKNNLINKQYLYIGVNSKKLANFKKTTINPYIFSKTIDPVKKWRQQKLHMFIQDQVKNSKKILLTQQLVTNLNLAMKYFNPQILADHIAKELEKTKKHNYLLKALKTILRNLQFTRVLGYRIAISGRLNSASKTRTLYLTKRQIIRQDFSKTINFATAQAKGRIGSFGIKIWLFY